MTIITILGVTVACLLIARLVRQWGFAGIVRAVAAIPAERMAQGVGFVVLAYLCMAASDLVGLQCLGRRMPVRRVALAAFCSVAIGHNVGLGGLSAGAIRFRFYGAWGLSVIEAGFLVLFAGLTFLLGLVSVAGFAALTELAPMRGHDLALAGLALPAAYLALSIFGKRSVTIWRKTIFVPPLHLALLQIAIGIASVVAIVGALQSLLPRGVAWGSIATAYVAADLTATLSTVPGGWGVLESIVVWLLPGVDPIGALVAFRVVYYVLPLALASVLLTSFEVAQRRPRARRVNFQLSPVQAPVPEPRTALPDSR
ncbi:lysylphosphatidylglycerol synthase transmembrane domain-containing protein [Roseiterribacter gracilis]|uniref:Membrane protein n=1 Tax=Roseiterribacter gracilis TaxID=2812848 RepID=A0A8S8X6Q5_9PROT|nr:membrane protein [Rhodospirillales bacterium TMPK1]